MGSDILSIQPGELKFPFELKKQVVCSLQLANTTDSYVAFKVKTTSPKKYSVRPNTSIVHPGATCDVTVTMQAQRDYPPDMQCKDKFLVQSVVVEDGAQLKEVSQELFNKISGKEVYEAKLKVVYVAPPQPPSPVPESAEEGVSPRPSINLDNGFDNRYGVGDIKAKPAEAVKDAVPVGKSGTVVQQRSSGFSFLFVLVVGLLGILVGFFLGS